MLLFSRKSVLIITALNSVVGYESDHVSYSSLPRQSVSPWCNYASDSEGRRFNLRGRYCQQCIPVLAYRCIISVIKMVSTKPVNDCRVVNFLL